MRNFWIPAAAVVVLLVLQTFPYKRLTWQTREPSKEQIDFAHRLTKVPLEFGDWQSEPAKVDQRELEASAATGSYSRVFRNRFDPEKKVEIFIVCGHPQDVTIHTPERCYKASGFKEDDEARKFPIDFGKEYGKDVAFFWTNRYKAGSEAEGQQSLRIFWSFSDDGEWVAPNFARLTLGRSPAVYKIYAIAPLKTGEREQPEDSPCKEFLREFLPRLNAVLFPTTETSSAGAETQNQTSGTPEETAATPTSPSAPAKDQPAPIKDQPAPPQVPAK